MRTHIQLLVSEKKRSLNALFNDANRLRKGSISFSLLLVLVAVGVGVIPLLFAGHFIDLIDALIGAKAIRAMTSEVQSGLMWLFVLGVIWIASVAFWKKLSGLAKRLVTLFGFGMAMILALVFALPASPLLMIFISLLLLVALFLPTRSFVIAIVVLSGLLTLPVLGSLVDAAIYNRASVSEALSMMVFTVLFVVLAGYGLLVRE